METYILEKYKALGTYWYIKCEDQVISDLLNDIKNILISEITLFENSYSRFIETSEISILNKTKILINPSKDLLKMLKLSLQFNEDSKNYFNIAVGGELEKLGYTGDFVFSKKGSRTIIPYLKDVLSISNSNVVVLNYEYNLDLGGIGKSYLINKLSKIFDNFKLEKYLINVGGDIYTSYSQDIYIQNPVNTSKYLSKINISKGGVATSTPFLRSWQQNTKKYHHLIDPNNKNTKLSWLSSTVVCDDIISADIWAKIILLANAQIEIPLTNIKVYLVDSDFNVIALM